MKDRKAIVSWLVVCLLFVALMVLVGGYTRLSGSGLSITQWKPVHGMIPPLGEVEWQEEFAAYQNSPQYNLVNKDMDITGFKVIFWPEYIHRAIARLIGIIFFLPLLVFTLRKSISKKFFWRLVGIFALGGLQGGIGWIMVKSGLADVPYVSHLKLALHLFIAFTIYALIFWAIADISGKKTVAAKQHKRFRSSYKLWFALLCIQIIFGAFMAGLHAGLIYNTWPSMNGEFIPSGLFSNEPPLENRVFVQFIHRTLGSFLAIMLVLWWYVHRKYIKTNDLTDACGVVVAVIFLQFVLGILTLINYVPLGLALTHQMAALVLWTAALYLLHRISSIKYSDEN